MSLKVSTLVAQEIFRREEERKRKAREKQAPPPGLRIGPPGNPGSGGNPEAVPEATLPLDEISKYETRIPLDLIRKDEKVYLERLTREIERGGITEPITIRVREDGSRIVWDGIHRLIVAQNLGIKNVPVEFIGEEAKPPEEGNPGRVRFDRGDINSAVAAARRLHSEKNLYIFATYLGFTIERSPPPGSQSYVVVHPDGSTETIKPSFEGNPMTPEKETYPITCPTCGEVFPHSGKVEFQICPRCGEEISAATPGYTHTARLMRGGNPTSGNPEPEATEPTLREMIIAKTYPGAPSNVRITVFPTKSFSQPGKYALFDVNQNAFFGTRRDTFQEAVEAANRENLRIGQPLLPTEPVIKRARKLLEPQQISDFRVGIDRVVREEGKTFVIDTEGIRKKIEVQSDVMTSEFEENVRKLNPEQKAKMIEQVRTTPYLSNEGRAERLAVLEPKPPAVTKPPMSAVEYDRRYTLEELREMARASGLSASGSKKEIAARLIARG